MSLGRDRIVIVAAAALLGACSLSNPSRDDCASADECRALFGAGFTCTPSGLCESVIDERCSEIYPADAADEPGVILFGTIFVRSSPNQLARERATRLAVDGINERNGIDGRRVALLHCDAASATDAADHLVDDVAVPAIVGPSSSSETEAVFSSHRDSGVLVISPAATATQLGAIDSSSPGRLWRTAPPDDLQAAVVIDDLMTLGASSVGIVARQNDTYAQSLSVLLQQGATDQGLTVVATPQFSDAGNLSMVATEALGGGTPDVVLFLSFSVADAAAFLDATAALPGYDGVTLYFTDAAANDELLMLTGGGDARYPQLRASRPATPDTIVTSEFTSGYRAAFGEDPLGFSFTANAYDATAMVILGAGLSLGESDEVTGDGIAAGLARMSGGSQVRELLGASFTAAIEDLRAGTSLDIVGASGELDYDPATEELSTATYEVLRIEAGAFVVDRSVSVP